MENIELPLMLHPYGKGQRRERVDRAMQRIDIAHRAKHTAVERWPATARGIARAVVDDPKLSSPTNPPVTWTAPWARR